ncbi:MAG: DHHA1 domain-containing protein [Planctomycetota bacterium]|nr:DHHA1 domain-containing protein [Planctomycetota bacterium]
MNQPDATADTTNGAPPIPSGVGNLRRFIDVARGRRRPLVHLQHNPDPDALGSGAAVQYLLKRLMGVDSILAYTGRVGRVENRAMLRYLKIEIMPSFKIDYDEHDLIIVVDTHPGSGTCRLPMGVVPDVVVDHHPAQPDALQGVAFPYFDPDFGSTSTMVGALFVANGIEAPVRIATALTYGIRTDTMDLARGGTAEDEAIYREMYAVADKQVLARIERARVPQQYFIVLERGLRHALVTDNALTTYLGEIAHSDAVAEIADLLFRLEGMKWIIVAGHTGPIMYCSIRATQAKDVRAGEVARTISDGKGGGHDTFAAAQIPMEPGVEPDAFYEDLRKRFLKEVGAKQTLTRPLTIPPDTEVPRVHERATGAARASTASREDEEQADEPLPA